MGNNKEHTRIAKIKNNKIPAKAYFKVFLMVEILFIFLYVRYAATFYVNGSRLWKLVAIAIVLGGYNYLASRKLERNVISLLTGTTMPIFLFDALYMWTYSGIIRRTIVVGTLAALLGASGASVWAFIKARYIAKPSLKRKVLISKSAFLARVLLCAVLIGTCGYGKFLINTHYTVSYSDLLYEVSLYENGVADYENSLAANIETVAQLDPEMGWKDLSLDEKMRVLETVIRIECRYLGMQDSLPSLEVSYLEEGLLGQYNYENDNITLSYNYIVSETSGYSILRVLTHEVYHRYQHYLVGMLEMLGSSAETAKYKNLLFLDKLTVYKDEIENYVSADGSDISFYLYHSQQLERDADKYGDASVDEYYREIQKYLGKTN